MGVAEGVANDARYAAKTTLKCTGEHRKDEEFGRVCASRQVPAISDGDFCLFERYIEMCITLQQLVSIIFLLKLFHSEVSGEKVRFA